MRAHLCSLVFVSLAVAGCQGPSASVFVDHLAIVNINPSHGAVGIGYDSDVNVTFSQTVRAETINAQTICITQGDPASASAPCASPVLATVTYDPTTLTARLVPVQSLLPDQKYELHLLTGIASDAGSLPVEVQASFRTIPTIP